MIHSTLKSKVHEDICLMLHFENHSYFYLCDCGFASDLSYKEAKDVSAIFVSHTHIDHFINFDGIMRHQLAVGRKIVVCGGTGIAESVQHKLLAFNWNLLGYDEKAVSYEVREIHPDGRVEIFHLQVHERWALTKTGEHQEAIIYENELFKVRYAILNHGVDCIAYLFEEHDKSKMNMKDCPHKAGVWVRALKEAFEKNLPEQLINVNGTEILAKDLFQFMSWDRGYKLGYIMDYAATDANYAQLEPVFTNADEVYIESYYGQEELELAHQNKHSTAHISGTWAKKLGVKKANPVHHSRRYHEDWQRQLLHKEFFAAFGQANPE